MKLSFVVALLASQADAFTAPADSFVGTKTALYQSTITEPETKVSPKQETNSVSSGLEKRKVLEEPNLMKHYWFPASEKPWSPVQ